MSMNKTVALAAVVAAGLGVSGTAVAEGTTSKYFVEGLVGASLADFDDYNFHNPDAIGAGIVTSPVSGDRILMGNIDDSDESVAASAAVGLTINRNLAVKASYHYFGNLEARGFADFVGGASFSQDLDVEAHGLTAGLVGTWDLSPAIFVEGQAELGMGFMGAEGVQGANFPPATNFPDGDDVNFIAGIGGGIGYRLASNMDIIVRASYYDLGGVETDTTGNPPPAGMNPNERLESDLETVTVSAGVRYRF
jgi:opacity protein-like surface antigen